MTPSIVAEQTVNADDRCGCLYRKYQLTVAARMSQQAGAG